MKEPGPKKGPRRGDMCLNCGLALDSNYCPNCGQHNTSHNHGLGQFLHEFLDEFLHLDSKILRTLIPLFTKPGFLTQEWTAGKRIRYITPLKLYVTLSAFCFLSWSLKGTLYGEQKTDLKFNVTAPSAVKASSPNDSALDSLFRRKIGTPSQSNIPAIRDKFVSQLPTTNFVLMPIVAGIFALLYVRRKRFYVEHLVFTLHYYSFTFMVLSVISLLPPHFLITKILSIIGILWVIAYLPIALVRNYQQGYFKTIAKLVIFGFIYAFVVAFALFWTLVVTAIALPNRPAAESTNSSITTVQP